MNSERKRINVAIVQTKNIPQKHFYECAAYIDEQLTAQNQKLSACHKGNVDFIVLPEDWIIDEEFTSLAEPDLNNRELRVYKDATKHTVDLEFNMCLREISSVVRKHSVYASKSI